MKKRKREQILADLDELSRAAAGREMTEKERKRAGELQAELGSPEPAGDTTPENPPAEDEKPKASKDGLVPVVIDVDSHHQGGFNVPKGKTIRVTKPTADLLIERGIAKAKGS